MSGFLVVPQIRKITEAACDEPFLCDKYPNLNESGMARIATLGEVWYEPSDV
jgi:hypothetical protein